MGHGSDSDSGSGSDSGRSSSSSVRSGKVKKDKKDKKDKKEKKPKDHKDHKDKDHKDKDKKEKDKKDKGKDKDKKDKGEKEKDKKDKDKDKKKDKRPPQPGYAYAYHGEQALTEPSTTTGPISVPAFNPNYPGAHPSGTPLRSDAAQPSNITSSFPTPPPAHPAPAQPTPMTSTFSAPPPGYPSQPPTAPASGYRTPLDSDRPFPTDPQELGPPVAQDADGSPIYVGSALFDNSVHPCKIGPKLAPPARVAYGGREIAHAGRYDLLPFVPDEMEWVPASYGQIPAGRRPVEGGYEENGAKLYHALANINGVQVPGKTGEHLGAVNVGYGGSEYTFPTDYRILCWRY